VVRALAASAGQRGGEGRVTTVAAAAICLHRPWGPRAAVVCPSQVATARRARRRQARRWRHTRRSAKRGRPAPAAKFCVLSPQVLCPLSSWWVQSKSWRRPPAPARRRRPATRSRGRAAAPACGHGLTDGRRPRRFAHRRPHMHTVPARRATPVDSVRGRAVRNVVATAGRGNADAVTCVWQRVRHFAGRRLRRQPGTGGSTASPSATADGGHARPRAVRLRERLHAGSGCLDRCHCQPDGGANVAPAASAAAGGVRRRRCAR